MSASAVTEPQANGRRPAPYSSEPNLTLEFERIDGSTIRPTVELDLEAAPPGPAPFAGEPTRLVFDATNEQLGEASTDLAATAPDVLERQRRRGQLI